MDDQINRGVTLKKARDLKRQPVEIFKAACFLPVESAGAKQQLRANHVVGSSLLELRGSKDLL